MHGLAYAACLDSVGAGGTLTSRDAKPYGLETCFGTQYSRVVCVWLCGVVCCCCCCLGCVVCCGCVCGVLCVCGVVCCVVLFVVCVVLCVGEPFAEYFMQCDIAAKLFVDCGSIASRMDFRRRLGFANLANFLVVKQHKT